MKKVIFNAMFAAAVMLAVSATVQAQKGLYLGVQGTRQLSVMFNKTDAKAPGTDYKSKFNSAFGITGGYHFTDNLGVGTELVYSTQRQVYNYNHLQYTQRFNYLKVPVLFTYNTNPASKIMFTAKAGPQIGVLLKAAIEDADNASLNGDVKDRYHKITFGGMGGVGARMRLGNNLYFDAGLHLDATFLNTEKKNSVAGRSATYNASGGFDAGIKYFFN